MQASRFFALIALQQRVLDAGGTLQAVMEAIVGEYAVMPQANGIVIELRDEDQIVYAAASGTSAPMIGLRLPIEGSLSGASIMGDEPLYCRDSQTDPRVNRAACERVGLRSMIVVPIPHNGTSVGVLKYHASKPNAFTDDDMLLAHLLVGPLTIGFSRIAEADAVRVRDELQSLMALKQQLIGTVSHELRTPLTAITGALGLIAAGGAGELPAQAGHLVDMAARNAQRLGRIVNDLLQFEKLNAAGLEFRPDLTDLATLITETVEASTPYADQNDVTLETSSETGLTALVDPDRIAQALTNLISNGVKFSPKGSTVRIDLKRDGDSAVLSVTDEGDGVPEDFRKRLFTPFAQAVHQPSAANLPGTGLGLAITKGIVDQSGGWIAYDDSTKGARFVITLPLV